MSEACCAGCSTTTSDPVTANGAHYCSVSCAETDQKKLLDRLQAGRKTHAANKAAGKYRRK